MGCDSASPRGTPWKCCTSIFPPILLRGLPRFSFEQTNTCFFFLFFTPPPPPHPPAFCLLPSASSPQPILHSSFTRPPFKTSGEYDLYFSTIFFFFFSFCSPRLLRTVFYSYVLIPFFHRRERTDNFLFRFYQIELIEFN